MNRTKAFHKYCQIIFQKKLYPVTFHQSHAPGLSFMLPLTVLLLLHFDLMRRHKIANSGFPMK